MQQGSAAVIKISAPTCGTYCTQMDSLWEDLGYRMQMETRDHNSDSDSDSDSDSGGGLMMFSLRCSQHPKTCASMGISPQTDGSFFAAVSNHKLSPYDGPTNLDSIISWVEQSLVVGSKVNTIGNDVNGKSGDTNYGMVTDTFPII